jgi:hypothetical protein
MNRKLEMYVRKRGEGEGLEVMVEIGADVMGVVGDEERENEVSGKKKSRKKTEKAWIIFTVIIAVRNEALFWDR